MRWIDDHADAGNSMIIASGEFDVTRGGWAPVAVNSLRDLDYRFLAISIVVGVLRIPSASADRHFLS